VTIEVAAGKEECFFETVKAGQTIDIDYQVSKGFIKSFKYNVIFALFQVVDGGPRNEMSITFKLSRPDGVPLVADMLKSDNAHR
jgi:protein ERP2